MAGGGLAGGVGGGVGGGGGVVVPLCVEKNAPLLLLCPPVESTDIIHQSYCLLGSVGNT